MALTVNLVLAASRSVVTEPPHQCLHRTRTQSCRPSASILRRAARSPCAAQAESARPGWRSGSAARWRPAFPDGVWLADQADAKSARQLVQIVASALGVRPEPDRQLAETLAESLRPREVLLILDTCEHPVAESAQLVEELMTTCPKLRVVATSREPLRTRGEVIWRVPPLGLPAAGMALAERPATDPADCEAVRLFATRATAVRPDFVLSTANAGVIAEICTTLDGVPLAIELAAARIRTLPAEQIRLRLASRFELLAMGDRTAPPRQQTLRAAVAWSYDQLAEPERLLLSRLSVFHGWSLEMAEQVCADEAIPARRYSTC